MSNQAQTPVIQIPGVAPSQGAAAPPAAPEPPAGTPGPKKPTRRSRGQRTKGLPGVPLAVGVVNVATTAGAEVAMVAGPEAAVAAGVAALAAGVYAMRSNSRYKRSPWSGPRSALGSLSPFSSRTGPGAALRTNPGPRTDRSGGPSSRTRSGGAGGPDRTGPGRRTRPDQQRTAPGPGRTKPGPDHAAGPKLRTKPGPGADQRTNKPGPSVKPSRANKGGGGKPSSGKHASDKPGKVKKAVEVSKTAAGTVRKGYKKTAPARQAAARNVAKFGKRVLWPAVASVLSGIRNRSWKQAVQTWKKRRSTKADADTTTPPEVSSKARKPTNPGSTGGGLGRVTSTGGAPSMPAAAFVAATAEMMGAASVYDPQGMMQVGNDLSQLPVALRNFAETMRIMTQRSNDNDPINPAIIDRMADIYKTLMAAATGAEDLGPMFRNLHAVDIQRLESPRKNEQRWDVVNNR